MFADFSFSTAQFILQMKLLLTLVESLIANLNKNSSALSISRVWDIKDFKEANSEIDAAFIDIVMKLIQAKGTPILMSLAGPTAAGKTEIAARLFSALQESGRKMSTIEMDNFLLDREIRGENPMGERSTHFMLFIQALEDIL